MPQHEQLDVFHIQAVPTTNQRTQQSPDGEIKEGEGHAADPPSPLAPSLRHRYWHPSAVNDGTAFEIALKIRELSGLVTEAYSPADLLHGPIAAIQPGWPVIVVAPSGPARPSVEEIVLPLRARAARLIAISDVQAVLRGARTRLRLEPGVPEWLSPLTAVVPGQVTALRLTTLRGLDLDQPSGLGKITLTR